MHLSFRHQNCLHIKTDIGLWHLLLLSFKVQTNMQYINSYPFALCAHFKLVYYFSQWHDSVVSFVLFIAGITC